MLSSAIRCRTFRDRVEDVADEDGCLRAGHVFAGGILAASNAAHDIARCTLALTKLPADDVRHTVVTKKLAWTLFNFYWGDKPAHIR